MATRTETYEVLEQALALIENPDNWCQNVYQSVRRTNVQYCSAGAINQTISGKAGFATDTSTREVREALKSAMGIESHDCISVFNDSHTHEEVVACFKQAIRTEKMKAGVPVPIPIERSNAYDKPTSEVSA